MSKFTIEDKQIIEENEKWFKFFVHLPLIVTIIEAVGCLVTSIVIFCIGRYWAWLGCTFLFGGIVSSAITYLILKLALSYKILTIYYLKQLANQKPETEQKPQINDSLPEI